MNALLEIRETQSQGLERPSWLPEPTSGLKKSENQPPIKIYSDQEPYDNIKMEGTSLFSKEEPRLDRFNGEIINIRADVAETKADIRDIKGDVAEIKTDMAVLKTEVKYITENTRQIPDIATNIAVINNELGHVTRSLNKIIGISIALVVTVVGGILVWYLTQR